MRVDKDPIRLRTGIYEPYHLVVLDSLLVEQVPVERGLKPKGIILINSNKPPETYRDAFKGFRVATVPASKIAFHHRQRLVAHRCDARYGFRIEVFDE